MDTDLIPGAGEEDEEPGDNSLEAQIAADPALAYLLPDDQRPGEQTQEDKDKAAQLSAEDRALFNLIRKNPELAPALLRQEGATPIEQQRQRQEPPQRQPEQQRQEQQQQPVDPEAQLSQLAGELEADFLKDPKMAFGKLLRAVSRTTSQMREQAVEDARREIGRVAGGAAHSTIDSYLDRIANDPVMRDPEVKATFQSLIDKARDNPAIANLTPGELRANLDGTLAYAVGQVQIKRARSRNGQQTQTPPNYSGGTRTGGSGGGPTRKLRLTDDERGLVNNLERAGKSKEVIAQALAEYRKDMGRT